jgi:hypothetical protein
MQVVAEQQAAHAPVTQSSEAMQDIEVPMEVDKGSNATASGVKRKAEEDPSEDSKKVRVGEYSLARGFVATYLNVKYRTNPKAQAVRFDFLLS